MNSRDLPNGHSDLLIDHEEWKAMLLPGKHQVVWRSSSMSFSLRENKNSFMLGARRLLISLVCGAAAAAAASESGGWVADYPGSRFSEVAKISYSSSSEIVFPGYIFIRGRIKAQMLSPETIYAAYLIFRAIEAETRRPYNLSELGRGFKTCIVDKGEKQGQLELMLGIEDVSSMLFDKRYELVGARRDDGWMEVEMGDFYVNRGANAEVEARLFMSCRGRPLIFEGIEFRPARIETPLAFKGKKKRKDKGLFFMDSKVEKLLVSPDPLCSRVKICK